MNWEDLLDKKVRDFILAHEDADVAGLALRASPDDAWDYPLVLDQIKARQKARVKMPHWFAHDGVVFPPAFVVEQASSVATARYKAGLVRGRQFVDLSAGAGADFAALMVHFESGVAVERDGPAAGLLAHNMPLLCDGDVRVVWGEAQDYGADLDGADLVYIDPQRRDFGGRRGKYRLEECSPDVLALLPALLEKAGAVMVKTSPMLDIWAGIEALGAVRAVHIIEWRGACREVLYILGTDGDALSGAQVPVTAVSLDDEGAVQRCFSFTKAQEMRAAPVYGLPLTYLYEPSAAFQKLGAFKMLALGYGAVKLHPDTHLYSADHLIEDFPGRAFEIVGMYPVQAKKIPVKRAHLSVRNFPQSVEILRKKLGLRDGGDDYLFACTLVDGQRVILHGRK